MKILQDFRCFRERDVNERRSKRVSFNALQLRKTHFNIVEFVMSSNIERRKTTDWLWSLLVSFYTFKENLQKLFHKQKDTELYTKCNLTQRLHRSQLYEKSLYWNDFIIQILLSKKAFQGIDCRGLSNNLSSED